MDLRVKFADGTKPPRPQAKPSLMATVAVEKESTSSQHMLKITKRGRPFHKDIDDLFSTLIISLSLKPHKVSFHTYTHSFSTDEAIQNLRSLKFSRTNRGPDPKDPSRLITITVSSIFSMERRMATRMSQHFMDSRFFENATNPSSNIFKDKSVYILTPKGLHVLGKFTQKNGIDTDKHTVLNAQPVCPKLLCIKRRTLDDEMILSQPVVLVLFRWFVGSQPNYPSNTKSTWHAGPHSGLMDRTRGVLMTDVIHKVKGKEPFSHKNCFSAVNALEWLCDFTSVVSRDESAEIGAQFVRFGLISLVTDSEKKEKNPIIVSVHGPSPGEDSLIAEYGEFRCTQKAMYKVTAHGRLVARWDSPPSTKSSSSLDGHSSESSKEPRNGSESSDTISQPVLEKAIGDQTAELLAEKAISLSEYLEDILVEPPLRSLFREHLRANFCEENLLFWLEVQSITRNFIITSSASRGISLCLDDQTQGDVEAVKHRRILAKHALSIYNTYLAPFSTHEINIDRGLRNELLEYVEEIAMLLMGKPLLGYLDSGLAKMISATQLEAIIHIYQRMQSHTFEIMLADAVPKFVQTGRFLSLQKSAEHLQLPPEGSASIADPETIGGTYISYAENFSDAKITSIG